MASQICGNCRGPNANSHCGKCQAVYYCCRECQVSHWKTHKRLCGQAPVKGQFTMTKSVRGTQISFGYESKSVSLKDKEEFEAAVAVVEKAGIEPPPIDDAGETSIKVAITSFNVPFIATLWLEETKYGENTPIEIRKVQEIATRITGASNIFHVLMQRAGDKITPSLSCKSATIQDQETAITYLNSKYFSGGSCSARWSSISTTHLLHLLQESCALETELLAQTLRLQQRIAKESNWATKEADIAALQATMDGSDINAAGQDLYELLSELTRRSCYDNRSTIDVYDIGRIVSDMLSMDSAVPESNASRVVSSLNSKDYRMFTKSISSDQTHLDVVATLEKITSQLIRSVHFPVFSGVSSAGSVPYYQVRGNVDPSVLSTLVTWDAEDFSRAQAQAAGLSSAESSATTGGVHIVDDLEVADDWTATGVKRVSGQLAGSSDKLNRLLATAYFNAHLLLVRAMTVDSTLSQAEFNDRFVNSVLESAALFAVVKFLKEK